MRLQSWLVAAALLSASLVAHADSLIGSTVDVKYEFPTTADVDFDSGMQTVTKGLKIVAPFDGDLTFTSANLITITNPGYGPVNADSFNGFEIDFLSGILITGAVLDPASNPAFATGALVTFTGNEILVNLAGTCQTCGARNQKLEVDVTAQKAGASVTPEPSSFVLLGTGMLGLAGVLRRRFR